MIELDYLDSLVAELWMRKQEDPRSSASQLMRELFREERLRPKQQKRVRDLFHDLLASARLVERALRVAAPGDIVDALRAPAAVLSSRVLSGDLSPRGAAKKLSWIDWGRVRGLRDEIDRHADDLERIELLASLPRWLAQRLVDRFGDDALRCALGLVGRAPTTLRANALLTSRDELAELLAQQGIETEISTLAPHGLIVASPAQLFRTAEFHRGLFELQDEASQLVAELVSPEPGMLVVDACAGAGGKTLAMAAKMAGRGKLLALDTHRGRLSELRRRARRAGIRNLESLSVPADAWGEAIQEQVARADRILLDVPCSGLGSLRRNPDMRERLDPGESERLVRIQSELLERAASLMAAGARLVYATCTILSEENEHVVERVMKGRTDLERVAVAGSLSGSVARTVASSDGAYLQTLPHRHGCDGFFAAILERR